MRSVQVIFVCLFVLLLVFFLPVPSQLFHPCPFLFFCLVIFLFPFVISFCCSFEGKATFVCLCSFCSPFISSSSSSFSLSFLFFFDNFSVPASHHGFYKIVQLLIADSRVDPSAKENAALLSGTKNKKKKQWKRKKGKKR